jgi:hypothetical protein
MDSIFIKITSAVAGLLLLTGFYYGNPGKRLRGVFIPIALLIVVAFLFAAIDRFSR